MSLPPKRKHPELALEIIPPKQAVSTVSKTVESARVDSINELLANAYQKASTLQLSEDEIKKLTADFPDHDFYRGAAGKEDLIYLSHQAIRGRLNSVIGVGRWSLIIRRNWNEEFLTARKEQAVRVYVEAILIVRGCFVGESIGDGTYYKANAAQNFGDAYESAKTAVLRRCAKEFGIGLQAWSKDFCESWKNRYKGFQRPK